MLEHKNQLIELFEMILARNVLCRRAHNARMRLNYVNKKESGYPDSKLKALIRLRYHARCMGSTRENKAEIEKAIKDRKKELGLNGYSKDKIELRQFAFSKAATLVYEFTQQTHARRMQLQRLFKTKQYKDCSNIINSIRVNYQHYFIKDIKKIVKEHKADQAIDELLLA